MSSLTEVTAAPTSVGLDVVSTVTRLALSFVIDQAGWVRCGHDRPCSCVTVTDQIDRGGRSADVIVTRTEPAACHDAIQAVVAGRARAVILNDEPESLTPTVVALAAGTMTIPQRALELSLAAPELSDRLRETLRLLAAGQSSRTIARALHESESTAKRDITELLSLFDVPNRTALISAATRLGFLEATSPPPVGERQPA